MNSTNIQSCSEAEFQDKLIKYKEKYNIPHNIKLSLEDKLNTLPPNSKDQIPNSYIIDVNGVKFYSEDFITFINYHFTITKSIFKEVGGWESGSFKYEAEYTGKVSENISFAKANLVFKANSLHKVLDLLINGVNSFVKREKQRLRGVIEELCLEQDKLRVILRDHNDMLNRHKEYKTFLK